MGSSSPPSPPSSAWVVQKLRTPGAQTVAAVAGILAALLATLPYKAGLTIATLAAIVVAVMVERRIERRGRA